MKSRTPYFLPKTAPPTKEGVERLRKEFYAAMRAAGFIVVPERRKGG